MEGDEREDGGVEVGEEGDKVRGCWKGIRKTGEYAMINRGGLRGSLKEGEIRPSR